MRIWSLHPRFLDRQGLIACWRESLLAQAVLAGKTRGYTRHPQLERFRECDDPLGFLGAYLTGLAVEADARGYRFDRTRILQQRTPEPALIVTRDQLDYEWAHLGAKLRQRSPDMADQWLQESPEPHPLFGVRPGPIADWERFHK